MRPGRGDQHHAQRLALDLPAAGQRQRPDPLGPRPPVEVPLGPRLTHVVFFATWCPPCLSEMPRLKELEATWGRQGYRLVLVAVQTRQTPERLAAFVEREAPPGRVILDADGSLQRAAGVEELPAHFLVGQDGQVLARRPSLREGVVTEVEKHLGVRRR